jgi:hypothetical protein
MNSSSCEHARGQIALAAIGRLPDTERLALDSHLEGCPECSNELAEISGLEAALSAAEIERVDQVVDIPETLRTAVLGSLETEVARHRRASRFRVLAIAAAVVILAGGGTAIGVAAARSGQSGPAPARTFALTGPGGASATVQLTAENWGTLVDLRVSGQSGGSDLTVSMREDNGSWWTAGTYQSVSGGVVNVTMSCAVPVREIDGVRVTNASGKQVLGTYDD